MRWHTQHFRLFPDILPNNEIFSRDSLFLDEENGPTCDEEDETPCDEDDDEEDDIIILHIDIREPIKRLKKLLEQKIAVNLAKYEFWLQDAQIVCGIAFSIGDVFNFVFSTNSWNPIRI